jgi:hypothetical protein
MIKLFVLLFTGLLPFTGNADPLLDYIQKINPYINKTFAKTLAKEVNTQAKRYGLDPFISIKIGMLESSLRMDAVSNTGDYGIFQINLKTMQDFGIPISDLGTLKGQVRAHMKILKQKIQVCSKRPELRGREWVCYHSFTPKYNELYYVRATRLIQIKEEISNYVTAN